MTDTRLMWMCVCVFAFSRVRLFATPWAVAHQLLDTKNKMPQVFKQGTCDYIQIGPGKIS